MKILIIRNFPSYMAVKNNTYNIQEVGLAKALVRAGHRCDIVFWTDKDEETVELSVGEYGKIDVFYRRGITKLKNTIYLGCKELYEKYDILQPCEYNQLQAWLLAKKYPSKTVIYHGPYYSSFNRRYNLMCKFFDAVFLKGYIKWNTKFIVKSEMAREFLVRKGLSPKNVCAVGVGIDAEMLSDKDSACEEPLFLKMHADIGKLKLLYVGRFEERRDIPFVLDVFSEVYRVNKEARLYMIGTGEKEYLKMVWKYADRLNVTDGIVWQERMEQKYLSEIYKMADFFLLPTEYEIFGMVLLEAMYYRTIVLTTRNGGSSTLIKDGKNGIIINNKDVDTWVKKIFECLANSNFMSLMGQCASKTIESGFTWDILARDFLKQYREHMGDKGQYE